MKRFLALVFASSCLGLGAVEPSTPLPPAAVSCVPALGGPGWSHQGEAVLVQHGAPAAVIPGSYADVRLHLEAHLPAVSTAAAIVLGAGYRIPLVMDDQAGDIEVDVLCQHLGDGSASVTVQRAGRAAPVVTTVPARTIAGPVSTAPSLLAAPPGAAVSTTIAIDLPRGGTICACWLQPLERTDHVALIAAWDQASHERGRVIYQTFCSTCHGTADKEGSLPTSRHFAREPMKNGADPYHLFATLERGFGQMIALPQYDARQKYDVINYLREEFFKTANPSQYTVVDARYLASLPRTMLGVAPESAPAQRPPPYKTMDFGPALFWTYQVAPGNFAYKGIAIRLDPGPGGVAAGHAWMVYDHDTMRVAAAYSGPGFIDWKGVAFDGSHGTCPSIVGERAWVNPQGPGWAEPQHGGWEDTRLRGTDGRPYGPLPRAWVHYRGLYLHERSVVVAYSVGAVEILEAPGLAGTDLGATVFTRTLELSPHTMALTLRLAPEAEHLAWRVQGSSTVRVFTEDGFLVARFPPSADRTEVRILLAHADQAVVDRAADRAIPMPDLQAQVHGGSARWPAELTTQVVRGGDSGPFAVDQLTIPVAAANPYGSWMRPGGFDFSADGTTAAVCTWNGDVWSVAGLGRADGVLHWRRMASGLFQPLGVKIVDGAVYVCCRDQIAVLRDLDGDGEADLIENFNNDHQVTEHFHEFAMGLQTDTQGNFYYGKAARHALPALVPQHGTLLRVSKDGTRTDIIASGFRAPNGVCINDDGTFSITDQEGHWTPKNRLDLVKPGGFYGNMGSSTTRDSADASMDQPVVWITNAMDRSPAEPVRVPRGTWGALGGSLLSLSYGTGRLYGVLTETIAGQVQGGVYALPMPALPTGLMRGRFHPVSNDLYLCGMVGWATNQHEEGGFYRIRRTVGNLNVPLALHAHVHRLELGFSRPLERARALQASSYGLTVWGLKRSAEYGSKHLDEHALAVTAVTLSADGCTVSLEVPDLQPTWGMEIRYDLQTEDGQAVLGSIHNSIFQLAP